MGQVQLAPPARPPLHVDPARAAGSLIAGVVSGVGPHSLMAGDVTAGARRAPVGSCTALSPGPGSAVSISQLDLTEPEGAPSMEALAPTAGRHALARLASLAGPEPLDVVPARQQPAAVDGPRGVSAAVGRTSLLRPHGPGWPLAPGRP